MTPQAKHQLFSTVNAHEYREPFMLFLIKGLWIVNLFVTIMICLMYSLEPDILLLVVIPVCLIALIMAEGKVMKTAKVMPDNTLTYTGQLVKDLVLNTFSLKKNLKVGILYLVLLAFLLFFRAYIPEASLISGLVVIPLLFSFYKAANSVRIYFLTH